MLACQHSSEFARQHGRVQRFRASMSFRVRTCHVSPPSHPLVPSRDFLGIEGGIYYNSVCFWYAGVAKEG